MFLTLLIGGLMMGCVYGITGLGYSLIYKASGLMNLSQGDFMMLGAFFGYTFYSICGLPYFVALAITLVIMFIIGYSLNTGIVTPLLKRNGSFSNVILCTLAVSMVFQNSARLIWGTAIKSFPSVFGKGFIKILGIAVVPEQLLVLGMAVVCMFALHFFMKKTRFGTAMRAAALDSEAASAVGINVQRTKGVTWGLSAMLAGAIGCAVGPMFGVYATMGALIGNKAFGGAVAGGYGNIYGTIIGGIFFGIIEPFVAAYLTTSFKDMISFGLLIVILIFMPNGLFREKVLD